ncbi:MAG: hypothetical protein M3R36_13605 [Bacteroidota bacterium]|nr:hypothetical protein [Bacteroidota bacterium]
MDTLASSNGQYELLKIILDFIGTIGWPIIIVILALVFKREFKSFLEKATKVELPGGFSINKEIEKARELATEIESERKPETKTIIESESKKSETAANKKMIELGLISSPSGLDINYYKKIADTDPKLALIILRIDFELMLRNLAKVFNIPNSENDSISKIISKLLKEGKITKNQSDFINTVFRISNAAAYGAPITKDQAFQVLEIAQVLIDDYVAWLDWGFSNK